MNSKQVIFSKAIAGNKMPGAPLLHLWLEECNEEVCGFAEQTQALPSSGQIWTGIVQGNVKYTSLKPVTKIVSLKGTTESGEKFRAQFEVDNEWNGKGGWYMGNTEVDGVPVRHIE